MKLPTPSATSASRQGAPSTVGAARRASGAALVIAVNDPCTCQWQLDNQGVLQCSVVAQTRAQCALLGDDLVPVCTRVTVNNQQRCRCDCVPTAPQRR